MHTAQSAMYADTSWSLESECEKHTCMYTHNSNTPLNFTTYVHHLTHSLFIIINTSTKVTCHNFDDLFRQCYWVWGDMSSITV